uniref:Uncharacterized protein n=1 Tax=Melopsittacus undulatus TaxID=13146 RepID=A0A8V5G6A7_MELUD
MPALPVPRAWHTGAEAEAPTPPGSFYPRWLRRCRRRDPDWLLRLPHCFQVGVPPPAAGKPFPRPSSSGSAPRSCCLVPFPLPFLSSFPPFFTTPPRTGPVFPGAGMSSGLVLRTPLPEDTSVFTALKPVTMSGEPGEDAPVFEDIKPPSRPLENPPELAQLHPLRMEQRMPPLILEARSEMDKYLSNEVPPISMLPDKKYRRESASVVGRVSSPQRSHPPPPYSCEHQRHPARHNTPAHGTVPATQTHGSLPTDQN